VATARPRGGDHRHDIEFFVAVESVKTFEGTQLDDAQGLVAMYVGPAGLGSW
jgi:hypothetical protein